LSPELGHWVLVVVVGSLGFLDDHMVKYAKPLLFVYVFFYIIILKLYIFFGRCKFPVKIYIV